MARILVVDDERDVRELFNITLKMAGHTTETARDGVEAVHKLADPLPDLILLDLMMPHMDGFAFLAHLRDQLDDRPLRVLVATAKVLDENDQRQLTAWPVVGVLSKAELDIAQVVSVVGRVLTKDPRRRNGRKRIPPAPEIPVRAAAPGKPSPLQRARPAERKPAPQPEKPRQVVVPPPPAPRKAVESPPPPPATRKAVQSPPRPPAPRKAAQSPPPPTMPRRVVESPPPPPAAPKRAARPEAEAVTRRQPKAPAAKPAPRKRKRTLLERILGVRKKPPGRKGGED